MTSIALSPIMCEGLYLVSNNVGTWYGSESPLENIDMSIYTYVIIAQQSEWGVRNTKLIINTCNIKTTPPAGETNCNDKLSYAMLSLM